jgi:hypothetical protein
MVAHALRSNVRYRAPARNPHLVIFRMGYAGFGAGLWGARARARAKRQGQQRGQSNGNYKSKGNCKSNGSGKSKSNDKSNGSGRGRPLYTHMTHTSLVV